MPALGASGFPDVTADGLLATVATLLVLLLPAVLVCFLRRSTHATQAGATLGIPVINSRQSEGEPEHHNPASMQPTKDAMPSEAHDAEPMPPVVEADDVTSARACDVGIPAVAGRAGHSAIAAGDPELLELRSVWLNELRPKFLPAIALDPLFSPAGDGMLEMTLCRFLNAERGDEPPIKPGHGKRSKQEQWRAAAVQRAAARLEATAAFRCEYSCVDVRNATEAPPPC